MIRLLALFALASASALAMEAPRKAPAPTPEPTPAPTPPLVEMTLPADSRPFVHAPDGGGITVEGNDEEMRVYWSATVEFPTEMVSANLIDAEEVESPIVAWPDISTKFFWQTTSRGTVMVEGPLIPGQTYRFRLREGLKDAAGAELDTAAWGIEATTPDFVIIEETYGERSSLNAQPQVGLYFNYPVRLGDVADGIWFQDRATREKFPAEVLLNRAEAEIEGGEKVVDVPLTPDEQPTGFRVRPLAPLPVNRKIDLVVDGVKDAFAGRGMPYVRVFALGTTRPLRVSFVAARNFPLGKPRIEIKFNQLLGESPLPPDAIQIDPPVPGMRIIPDGHMIMVEGEFDLTRRYVVTVGESLRGAGGYSLARSERWGATFRPKRAAILFPELRLRQRSDLGLNFAFYQVNTSELTWKIAPIPPAQLATVLKREREFAGTVTDSDGNEVWTKDGYLASPSSEPMIDALALKPVASGTFPASGNNTETLRELRWKPADAELGLLGGPMLVEVTGHDDAGRTIGNRAVVFFGDLAITRKENATHQILRTASMTTAEPVPGVKVTAYDSALNPLGSAVTNSGGRVAFRSVDVAGLAYIVAEHNGRTSWQPLDMAAAFPGGSLSGREEPALRAFTFTDRPLYRPGQTIQFKGIVRTAANSTLSLPVGGNVQWSIERAYGDEVFASGESTLDTFGSWNGSWTPPDDAPLGNFRIRVNIDNVATTNPATFQIEEFRNPAFSIECKPTKPDRPALSVIEVASRYFHGSPNVGSRVVWKATWFSDSDGGYAYNDDGTDMTRVDLLSANHHRPAFMGEVTGEAVLGADGTVILTCDAPFKDPGNRATCNVSWRVDITGPDGQTLTGGANEKVDMEPVLLGVRRLEGAKNTVTFAWDARSSFGIDAKSVECELFRVDTRSVKERLAPNVYRFRNVDEFVSVEKRTDVTQPDLVFSPKKPGRYVLVVSPAGGGAGFPVSEEAYLGGDEESYASVESETQAEVFSLRDDKRSESKPWMVGETARLTVLTPAAGIAWVSVETDRVLDTFTLPITGNTTEIEIPVRPEYEPNAFVTVYLLRPGGTDALAGEIFGSTTLNVLAPGRDLDVKVATSAPTYQPGETVSGEVRVTADGKPAANADVAIYAVDDSILTLGNWSLPSFLDDFFPRRTHRVVTYSALKDYFDRVKPSWLTMKGFVVGGGGEDDFGSLTFVRKEFQPIILWEPNVTTDAAGVAKFSCKAPDNLTRFRAIAVAQTKQNQFGAGDGTFEVSKPLVIESALPRFVREGDTIELRAVIRQKVADTASVRVRALVEGGLTLENPEPVTVTANRNAPAVATFRAKVGQVGAAKVTLQAVADNLTDAMEVTVPVAPAVVLARESAGGSTTGPAVSVGDLAPPAWSGGSGTFQLSVSTTPWLARLMGIPYLIEYPHGCFEQKTSQLLVYTYLANLLDDLPGAAFRQKNYAHVISKTFDEITGSLLPGGFVPYWPGGTEPSDFVTIQTAWCVAAADAAGLEVPEALATNVLENVVKIASRTIRADAPSTLRTTALLVATMFDGFDPAPLEAAANELYLIRDTLSGEARAILTVAMSFLEMDEAKRAQMIAEFPKDTKDIAFDPRTFSSRTRAETMMLWARLLNTPETAAAPLRKQVEAMLEEAPNLSTQENLWLLVVFDSMVKQAKAPKIAASVRPKPDDISSNTTAVAWNARDLGGLATFKATGLPAAPLTYVLSARYRKGGTSSEPKVANGMSVERVVKNLTDPARDGSAAAPFKLGDQIAISYRFTAEKPQAFVALEDMIPAGLEVVNPNLPAIAEYYPAVNFPVTTALSHSEMRDQQTNLYFDSVAAGAHEFAVLARATAAGDFGWPSTQITPMYDSRVFGRSPSSRCVVAP